MMNEEKGPLLSRKQPKDDTPKPNQNSRHSIDDDQNVLNISIQPEIFRFYAYVFFWMMAIFAMILTEYITADHLLQGPKPGEPACPPFDRFGGRGFDIHKESHLIEAFGFNNICSNWDYSPSREIVALFYPVFEYTLLMYIVADFVTVALAYQKGWTSRRFWITMKCLFPIMILFCSWFRMIFVILAYQNVKGHTAGFLGLQLVLMMVACLNVWYIMETNIAYDFLGGREGTRLSAGIYLVIDLCVSTLKFVSDAMVVTGYSYPKWGLTLVFGNVVVGEVVDIIWMLFNALLPTIIAYVRSKSEQPLEISISMKPPKLSSQGGRDHGSSCLPIDA